LPGKHAEVAVQNAPGRPAPRDDRGRTVLMAASGLCLYGARHGAGASRAETRALTLWTHCDSTGPPCSPWACSRHYKTATDKP